MVAILLLKKKKVIMLGLRKPVRQLMQPVRERYIYIYIVLLILILDKDCFKKKYIPDYLIHRVIHKYLCPCNI